jgi:hypothetical protein
LNRLFEGAWVQEVRAAVHLPLGMIQDPRHIDGTTPEWPALREYQSMGLLLSARALQLQTHGDIQGALDHWDTALALSRQLKNYAMPDSYTVGNGLEDAALYGLRSWLQPSGPDQERLRAAWALLQQHEAARPDPANALKAQYVVYRDSPPQVYAGNILLNSLLETAHDAPWEKERFRRIFNAIYFGQLREFRKPLWQNPGLKQSREISSRTRVTLLMGMPPDDGPGASVSAQQWDDWIDQLWLSGYTSAMRGFYPPSLRNRSRQLDLDTTALVIAVARFQAAHGRPPARLDDLVSAQLMAALPLNPFNGQPFNYRISTGEVIEGDYGPITLKPGQAVVWCKDPDQYYPVPVWDK